MATPLNEPPEASWKPPPKSKWSFVPSTPKCPACRSSIYPAELVMASDRTPFHKSCVKCTICKKSLTPSNLTEHKTQLYCSNCYQQVFMEKDYQQYSIQKFSGVKAEEDAASIARSLREKELRSKDKYCPECEGQVWPIDGINVGDNVSYHQSCVVCAECGLGPDHDIIMVLGPKDRFRKQSEENQAVYCTKCFDKIPKIVPLTISETLSWEK